jgi:hypothetical protein
MIVKVVEKLRSVNPNLIYGNISRTAWKVLFEQGILEKHEALADDVLQFLVFPFFVLDLSYMHLLLKFLGKCGCFVAVTSLVKREK